MILVLRDYDYGLHHQLMDIKNRPEPSCPESIAIDMSQMLGLIFGIGDYSPYELALRARPLTAEGRNC